MSSLESLVEAARMLPQPCVLGIVGPPGSGKSTMTGALREALGWAVVEMDGFHLADAELVRIGRRDRKGAPDTFDVDGFVALLRRIRTRADDVVYAPQFRRSIEDAVAGALAVPRGACVIVEGLYLAYDDHGWSRVRPELDALWYVDTPHEECRARLIERASLTKGAEGGARWVDTVDEPNARLVAATRSRCDAHVTLDLAAT